MSFTPPNPLIGQRYLLNHELVNCNLSSTNAFMHVNEPTLFIFKIFGLMAISKNKNGTMKSERLSLSYVYCLLLFAVRVCSFYISSIERSEVIKNFQSDSFEEIAFLYSFYLFGFFDVLPLFYIFESKKIKDYYNDWAVFQARYAQIARKKLHLRIGIFRYGSVALEFAFFFPLSIIYALLLLTGKKKIILEGSNAYIFNIASMSSVTFNIVMTHGLWYTFTVSLYRASQAIIFDIQDMVKNDEEFCLSDYEKLWVDLAYLVKSLGKACGFSISYYLVVAVLGTTIECFLAVTKSDEKLFIYGLALWISAATFFITANMAKYEVVDEFKNRLIDIKFEGPKKLQVGINQFLKTINKIKPEITLHHFATLNNKLVISLLNNFTTYIIILVQFRQDTQEKKVSDRTSMTLWR